MEKTHNHKSQQNLIQLYIAPLHSLTTKEDLEEFFSKLSLKPMNLELVMDKTNDKICKGFGFVSFLKTTDIDVLLNQGHEVKNRTIYFEQYSTEEELYQKRQKANKKRVFASNIPKNMTDDELKDIFSVFGEILSAYKIRKYGTKRVMPYGYLFFKFEKSAQSCIKAGGLFINERHGFIYAEPYLKDKQKRVLNKEIRIESRKTFKKKNRGNIIKNEHQNVGNFNITQGNPYGDIYWGRGYANINQEQQSEYMRYEYERKLYFRQLKRRIREEVEFHNIKPTSVDYWVKYSDRIDILNRRLFGNTRINRGGKIKIIDIN